MEKRGKRDAMFVTKGKEIDREAKIKKMNENKNKHGKRKSRR